MINSIDRTQPRVYTQAETNTNGSGADFAAELENAAAETERRTARPPEKKNKNEFWEHRMDLTEKYFEQKEELQVKKQRAKLREAQMQMTLGKDYKGAVPTLSAAEILFGDDLLSGGE